MNPSIPAPVVETDVAVIGAGPVGLFTVFQCGMLGLSCTVIDALPDIGGQCTAVYPEKPIYDIPGFPRVEAASLIAALEEQAAPFAPLYVLGQQVVRVSGTVQIGFDLETEKGNRIKAKAIIIAAGAGAFGPNRPPLDGIESYEGTSVFYMVRRRDDFAGKRIVIAGGGDSAVDWALSLAPLAARVMVVHRRDNFRAAPESVMRMQALADAGEIDLVVPYQLKSLDGVGAHLRHVTVATMDGAEKVLEADVLLPFFGLAASLGPIADWGLAVDRHHIPVDPSTAATSVPGIYAVGDVATYPQKLKLILTGFAEVAQAAHAIYRQTHPGQDLHMEYSTTKGIPGGV
ncbi:NAD(P)/FAD-dependent oxidoreductase [Micavibrio aeruginosavorus]|uniref:NAD(P)/FAD-dependent oxidoreductase n=1 Tax=Micavibrio aeruginosavorus TaxID=349221 RepID=UPI003F4AB306